MSARTYIRPVGPWTPATINGEGAPGDAVRIGERAGLHFTAFELIERDAGDKIDRRLVSLQDAQTLSRERGPRGGQLQQALQLLAAPRSSIGGLGLAQPRIMGIVNVTPDSFSDGGRYLSAKEAIAHGRRLDQEGADILDIGGESTRPGAAPVPLDEELRRVMPVIEGLAGQVRARLSVDTRNADVMRRAAVAGVHFINDVSALTHDPQSLGVVVETCLPIVLMHAKGDPSTMQIEPKYNDALLDVFDYLAARVEACVRAGVPCERIIVDPGIGFGKTVAHNLEILAGLSLFHTLGTGLMLGVSRKSFIGRLLGGVEPAQRMPGSIAAALAGIAQGVQILRVHDVAATRQALTIWQASTMGAAQ